MPKKGKIARHTTACLQKGGVQVNNNGNFPSKTTVIN
jgi:hypothetical protein